MPADDRITLNLIANDLSSNLIIEAGAGTGKTYALVSRLVALLKSGARMRNIVAITFTEAAAAELLERIRSRIEQLLDDRNPDNEGDLLAENLSEAERKRLDRALAELEEASIQTIHSFAAQLLRESPLNVGLPPGWAALDEIAAGQHFGERWEKWLERVLGSGTGDSKELTESLRYLLRSGVRISNWRSIAESFSENRHRLPRCAAIVETDLSQVVDSTLRQLSELSLECSSKDDRLYDQLQRAIEMVKAVQSLVDDPIAAVQALDEGGPVDYKGNVGAARNWAIPPKDVRAEFRELGTRFQSTVRVAAITPIITSLGEFALQSELERKADGVATFDDLLVWARDLLRDHEGARRHLQARYSHILIDEFQDTDPLQAEIAFYLAADPGVDVRGQSWEKLPLSPGKLFVVGDDKQAIYRFRGADIGVARRVKEGGQLRSLTLSENRRSQETILNWVNTLFGECGLMTGNPGIQAEYIDLNPNEALQQEDIRASVQLLGGQMDLTADETRFLQASDITNVIAACVSGEGASLSVYDRSLKRVRRARLSDISILVQSRTGLGILTRALEDAGIPYRLEGGSLLLDTQEVRDLLNCLRAIDDPSDEVSVVAALRSPAFACSDVDLVRWRDAGGPWNYMSGLISDSALSDDRREARRLRLATQANLTSVRSGVIKMRDYHDQRQDTDVSSLISEFIRERRLDELDLVERRPREVWRRRSFLTEQARALEYGRLLSAEDLPLSLYHFLKWVGLQQEEEARVSEVVVPDTDDDAVRIMTMHTSKGLEFPIVFLVGLSQDRSGSDGAVLYDNSTGAVEIKLGDAITGGYEELRENEREHGRAEKVRLAYVAATRARDHLFLSMFRGRGQSKGLIDRIEEHLPVMKELITELEVGTNLGIPYQGPVVNQTEAVEYDPAAWLNSRQKDLQLRGVPRAVTATGLARAAIDTKMARDDIDDKDAGPNEEMPALRGRGGTAFGSALHAVLQEVLEQVSEELPLAGDSSVNELLSGLHSDIEALGEVHASGYGISSSRKELVDLAVRTLRNQAVISALGAPRLWSEIPVASQVETKRGNVVVEGIIDLLYEDVDGELVIVDYKSDYVPNATALSTKVDTYRWQGAAYAAAVEKATGKSVKDVQLLFVRADEARSIPDLRQLVARMPEVVAQL